MAEAEEEEKTLGRVGGSGIQIGQNSLSEQVLIIPVVNHITGTSSWCSDYKSVFGTDLDKSVVKEMVAWLATRLVNALQLVIVLHRFFLLKSGPENTAAKHIRIQALADLILVVESSLRLWQTNISGQLHSRMETAISANTSIRNSFDAAHSRFCATYPSSDPNRETGIAVNWAVNDAVAELAKASTAAERAGIITYLAVRLRNSLMHVIDDSLDIYNNEATCERIAGLMLITARLSEYSEKNRLASI